MDWPEAEELMQQHRCVFCRKKTFEDMVLCYRCEEYKYCSPECLENDRLGHLRLCNKIGVKKGIRIYLDAEQQKERKYTIEKAKTMDSEGNVKYAWLEKQHGADDDGNASSRQETLNSDVPKTSDESILQTVTDNKGRFGGHLKCSETEKSGSDFGTGWWKAATSDTKSKTGEDRCSIKAESKQGANQSWTGAKPKQKTSQNNNDANSKQETSQNTTGAKSKHGTMKTNDDDEDANPFAVSLYDAATAKKNMEQSGDLEMCHNCNKFGYNRKTCGRCKRTKYCNKTCQKADYGNHKQVCKRYELFAYAYESFPEAIRGKYDIVQFGFNNGLLNDIDRLYMGMGRMFGFGELTIKPVLAEIVQRIPHPCRYVVIIKDVFGVTTEVHLDIKTDDYYYHPSDDKTLSSHFASTPIPLRKLLIPGYFILLLKPFKTILPNGTECVHVTKCEQVHIIPGKENVRKFFQKLFPGR